MEVEQVENHDAALGQTVSDVRARLLWAELLIKLKKFDLPGADFQEAKKIARSAAEAIRGGQLGYALMVARQGEPGP